MSSRVHIATLAAAHQSAADERCRLRFGWRGEVPSRRFSEAILSLFGADTAQVEVPSPTGWRPVEADEAARRLRAGPTALRFQLGNTSNEISADAAHLTIGPGPLEHGPVELTWLQANPILRSPLPVLAVPLLDGAVHIDLLHALVALAHACSPLDHAEATAGGTTLRWSATEAGQPLVASAHGARWRPASEGPADALRFLAAPAPLPDLPATLRAAVDLSAQSDALAEAVPCTVRLVPLDGAPATFHVPPPANAILRLVPEDDAVRVELDPSLEPDRALWALCHAAAHLRLGHVRPGDTHGHWDTRESIYTPGRRWDREVRDRLPGWAPPSAPTRASLDECTPREKAWLVLLDHIGRMVGEARTLHPAAERYQAAAYQRQAAQRLVAQLEDYSGAMLCDGVGLGKTYVATTVLVHYANTWRERLAKQGRSLADDPFRVTILSPNSVVSTWQREAIPPLGAHGVVPAHVRVISHTKLSRILPSSQILERTPSQPSDMEHLLLSDLVVVDEAHNFRSVGARRTTVLRDLLRLQPRKDLRRKVLLLTATPVNNSLEDLRQQAALLFSKPLWFNDNLTSDGYRGRVGKDVRERIDKAIRGKGGDVAAILIHGAGDAKFSYAPDFRDDLQFGVQVPRVGDYLKEQEKRLAAQQAAVRAAMQTAQPTPLEPVRIAGELLDRIVVQRSRALCKQIELEQGSDVKLLFRPDAPEPEKLVYEDVYDDTRDVLARFLPLFETGEEAERGPVAPLSLKVYMWADVRDGTRVATDVSSVVGLQRVLVLKRLESSPVAFLITLLRLLALYAHRLKQLADLCHDLSNRDRASSLDRELSGMLNRLDPVERDRIDLLLTGKASGQRGRELLKRWSQAHMSAKAAADSDDPSPPQLDMFNRDDPESAARREQLDRLWGLREDLARDLGTLLATAPGLADIVFGRFDQADWPRKFINGGQGVDWPTSATWAMRLVTDGKLRRLVGRLLRARAEGQKAIVFSQFTDTLAYVHSVLRAARGLQRHEWALVTGMLSADAGRLVSQDEVLDLVDRCAVVSGETEDRDLVIHAFAPYYRLGPHRPRTPSASPEEQALLIDLWRQGWAHALQHPADVLLATDVLAEGVNLQDAALLVNYDVHWNPVRMIQRAGRIDRRLNATIEEARAFPDLDDLAAEMAAPVPRYWWHDHPGAAPVTVNLLLPDELEAELQLRERIANKTLAIDFTLGLEQGTGAEADWMADYRYGGISALNAWQGDRAIEQVAGYQERLRRLLADRTIDPAWVQRWNGWLREVGAGEDGPIVAWAAIGRRGGATTEHSRTLHPVTHEGVPHWLWTSPNPGESLLNFWLVIDGKTWPPTTRRDLSWSERASRPVGADDLLGIARRVVDQGVPLHELGRELGKPLRQGLTAISAGYLGNESDRLVAQATAFRLLQLRRLAPDPREPVVHRRGIARPCPACGHDPGMHKCCPTCGARSDGEAEIELTFGFRQMRNADGAPYETPQTWCRACRALDNATRPSREEEATC